MYSKILYPLVFIGLVFMILISGCVFPPKPPITDSAIPNEFEIRYGYGACQAEWGRTNVFITANGNDGTGSGIYEKGSGRILENERFEREEFRKAFTLTESEMLGLINGIEQSGFYSLKDYYSDPDIIDGGCGSIFVTKNNITKSVAVSNVRAPAAYSKVADLIYNLAVSHSKG